MVRGESETGNNPALCHLNKEINKYQYANTIKHIYPECLQNCRRAD